MSLSLCPSPTHRQAHMHASVWGGVVHARVLSEIKKNDKIY